jgi:hypothetical protein
MNSKNSSVSNVTCRGLDDRRSFTVDRNRDFFSDTFKQNFEPLSLEVKWQERESYHSLSYSAKLKCAELYLHYARTSLWRDAWA